MDKQLIIDQMKDLLNEDYLLKLVKIIDSYDRKKSVVHLLIKYLLKNIMKKELKIYRNMLYLL